MKETICTAFGLVGSFLAALFGGWDSALATLLIFMGVDYVTGLMVAALLDVVLGTSYVRAGVCIAFLCNEVISILENAGLMGVPLPAALKNAVELL